MPTATFDLDVPAAITPATDRRPMIQLENIQKVYRTDRIETVALADINIDIDQGELVSIMGPSGCGKSTLLNLMGLLDEPSEGRIRLNGRVVDSYRDCADVPGRDRDTSRRHVRSGGCGPRKAHRAGP